MIQTNNFNETAEYTGSFEDSLNEQELDRLNHLMMVVNTEEQEEIDIKKNSLKKQSELIISPCDHEIRNKVNK